MNFGTIILYTLLGLYGLYCVTFLMAVFYTIYKERQAERQALLEVNDLSILSDNKEYVFDVSINISPASRGKGFGKQLLNNGIRRLNKEVKDCKFIRAEVKKDNESSNKLFKSCGFEECEPFAHYSLDPNSCYYNLKI